MERKRSYLRWAVAILGASVVTAFVAYAAGTRSFRFTPSPLVSKIAMSDPFGDHKNEVCIGACSNEHFKVLQRQMGAMGLPLITPSASGLGLTSLLVEPRSEKLCIAALKDIKKRHPSYYLLLPENVAICHYRFEIEGAVLTCLSSNGISTDRPIHRGEDYYVTIAPEKRQKGVDVLKELQKRHPEYHLELKPNTRTFWH